MISGASNSTVCEVIDYSRTVQVEAAALITLTADPLDNSEIKNSDWDGNPLVVPEIPPAPAAYDGQFVQVDVVSVTAMP